jgi:ABC-2 type transport system ATP-binding protein
MTAPQAQLLLDARALSRHFDGHAAVRELSLELRTGDVIGFVGKNGAGKTTTMRMLAGVLAPSSGAVTHHARVGYAPETPQLDPDLSVEEQLELAASLVGLAGRARDIELGRVMGLTDVGSVRKQLTSTISKGTKQRVGLAQALLGDPPVLLLDEPTAGLDPAQIASVRRLVASLAETHAVLLSTHHVGDVLATCTRVVVLARGRAVLARTRAELGDAPEATLLQALVDDAAEAAA